MSCGKTRKRFELVSPCHFSSNIDMALPLRNERHLWLRFNTQGYTEEEIYDFETTLERLYYRKIYLGKQGTQMSRGHFIARLGMHFAVITKQSLRNLAVEVRELTTIDIKDVTSENFRIS
ncbi:hypothetical protein Tco_0732647 [Tanacetum coccineum]